MGIAVGLQEGEKTLVKPPGGAARITRRQFHGFAEQQVAGRHRLDAVTGGARFRAETGQAFSAVALRRLQLEQGPLAGAPNGFNGTHDFFCHPAPPGPRAHG